MTDIEELQVLIDRLRSLRERCEPKNSANRRCHRYSSAVSSLLWIIDDLQAEDQQGGQAIAGAEVGAGGPRRK